MGFLTGIKIGGIALVVLALLGNFLYVKHLQHKVQDQQAMIDSQASQIKVLDENQKATKEIVDKLTKTRRRVVNEQQTIKETISDPTRFVDFTRKYRMRPDSKTDSSKDGKGASYFKGKAKSKTIPTTQ